MEQATEAEIELFFLFSAKLQSKTKLYKTKLTLLLWLISFSACTNNQEDRIRDTKDAKTFKRTIPVPDKYVLDLEGVFTKNEINYLDSMIFVYEKKTTNEVGIITLDGRYTDTTHFNGDILNIANSWGVGKPGKNNGIMIGISILLKRICIQNGYGIEKLLSDAATKIIIDSIMIPEFKNGDYFTGTKNGLFAIMSKVK